MGVVEALKGNGADASPRRLALGTRTNADAADYFQTVVLEVSQVLSFEELTVTALTTSTSTQR